MRVYPLIRKQKHTFTCNNGGTNGIFICRLHTENRSIGDRRTATKLSVWHLWTATAGVGQEGFLQLYQQWNSDNIGYRIARTVAHKGTTISKWDCRAADKDSFQFGDAERTSPGGYFAEVEQQRRRIEYRWMKGTNAMFYLTYNYTNARRSRMAIACVIRCKKHIWKAASGAGHHWNASSWVASVAISWRSMQSRQGNQQVVQPGDAATSE